MGGMDSEQSDNTEPNDCYVVNRPPRKIKIFDNIENSGTEIIYVWNVGIDLNVKKVVKSSRQVYKKRSSSIRPIGVHVDIKKGI